MGIANIGYSRTVANNKGFWRESGGTIYLSNKQWRVSSDGGKTFKPWAPMSTPNSSMKIRHGSDERGQYFTDLTYDGDLKFYKSNIK